MDRVKKWWPEVDKSDGIRFGRTKCARRVVHMDVHEQSKHEVVRFPTTFGKPVCEVMT